jgi:multidrug transporter EmrE-like cation transporter
MKIIIILSSVMLNCTAQLLIRKGMLGIGIVDFSNFTRLIWTMLTNLYLWFAMICYGVSIILWMIVLSKVEVSYAYPFLSIGYVVASMAGYYFFNESLSLIRVMGIIVICIGVYLISRS